MNNVLQLYKVTEVSAMLYLAYIEMQQFPNKTVAKSSTNLAYQKKGLKYQHDHLFLSQKGNGESNVSYLG